MSNRIHKIKFRDGKDANRSLIKKSVTDFIRYGKMDVSVKKAKVLKSTLDRLVHKAQRNTNADKNMLLKAIGDKNLITVLTNEIAPKFKDRTSGFIKMSRLGRRLGDGTEIARIEWVISMKKAVAAPEESTKEDETAKTSTAKKSAPKVARSTAVKPTKSVTAPKLGKQVKKRGDK